MSWTWFMIFFYKKNANSNNYKSRLSETDAINASNFSDKKWKLNKLWFSHQKCHLCLEVQNKEEEYNNEKEKNSWSYFLSSGVVLINYFHIWRIHTPAIELIR